MVDPRREGRVVKLRSWELNCLEQLTSNCASGWESQQAADAKIGKNGLASEEFSCLSIVSF